MKRAGRIILATCVFVLLSFTCRALPAKSSRLVNDYARIFTASQVMALEQTLVAFDDSTSNQIAVVTVKDFEGYSSMEYATRLGLSWQVGSGDFNNGVVVLVKPKTARESGDVAIAVGYGLEGAIPDAYAKRIVENEMIPYFRENDYYSGVVAACEVLMKLASGEIKAPRGGDGAYNIMNFLTGIILVAFIIFLFVFLFIKAANEDRGGGNNGGSGGGGGGRVIIIPRGSSYSGGRSSGSIGGFGGFGGGSFGGGGASGKW